MAVVVDMHGIKKSFGHVTALDGMDFSVRAGEITALVGDNGCGKTTLMKILGGVLQPDAGEIVIGGKSFASLSVHQAKELGVTVMFQDLALDPTRDTAGNVFLGREPLKARFWLDKRRMREDARALLERFSIKIDDVETPVAYLSGGQRQSVALARALQHKTPIMVFDEPTSAMGVAETAKILGEIRRLKDDGIAVILISHNLFHVFDLADRVTVMALGRQVATFDTKESSPEALHQLIVAGGVV